MPECLARLQKFLVLQEARDEYARENSKFLKTQELVVSPSHPCKNSCFCRNL